MEAVKRFKQKTLLIVKPDGVLRALLGEIIQRIERAGLKIVALKMVVPTREQLVTHYNKSDQWFLEKGEKISASRRAEGLPVDKEPIEYGRAIIEQLVAFMTAAPVVAMVVEGNESVAVVKKLVGSTEPATSDVGTIRGDFNIDSYELAGADERAVRNLIHCSDQVSEAEREIAVWFSPEEILTYHIVAERVMYDANLDGILE